MSERKPWKLGGGDIERIMKEAATYRGESLARDAWRRLRRNRSSFLCLLFLFFFALLALTAPFLPLPSPVTLDTSNDLKAPFWATWEIEREEMLTGETPEQFKARKEEAKLKREKQAVPGTLWRKRSMGLFDDGWRHRSILTFNSDSWQEEDKEPLLQLVEQTSGRKGSFYKSAGKIPGTHNLRIAVPLRAGDVESTKYTRTGREGEVLVWRRKVAQDRYQVWYDMRLPVDLELIESWGMQTDGRVVHVSLFPQGRPEGSAGLRYEFRLDLSGAESVEPTPTGIAINGVALTPGTKELAAQLSTPAALEPPWPEVLAYLAPTGAEAVSDVLNRLEEDSDGYLLRMRATTVPQEQPQNPNGTRAQKIPRQRTSDVLTCRRTSASEQRGAVHAGLETRVRTALAASGAFDVTLASYAEDNGYTFDLNAIDSWMLDARCRVFGLWQASNWMGSDSQGRDLFARILWGSRTSILVSLAAAFCSLIIGVTYGALSGLLGGRVDNLMMRFVDILYSVPFIFVVIFLITIVNEYRTELEDGFGIDREMVLYVVIGAIYWLTMARVVRGQVLSLKNAEFIEAARVMGASTRRILFAHLVPNVLSIVIVYLTLTIPQVMLFEAFLSFLGLGIEAPKVSWGLLASNSSEVINPIHTYWWLVAFPAAAMGSTLLALNVLGDGLRDALDPKLRGKD